MKNLDIARSQSTFIRTLGKPLVIALALDEYIPAHLTQSICLGVIFLNFTLLSWKSLTSSPPFRVGFLLLGVSGVSPLARV